MTPCHRTARTAAAPSRAATCVLKGGSSIFNSLLKSSRKAAKKIAKVGTKKVG